MEQNTDSKTFTDLWAGDKKKTQHCKEQGKNEFFNKLC